MIRFLPLLLLAGCVASTERAATMDSDVQLPTNSLITTALNQGDLPLLTAAFSPQHPLQRHQELAIQDNEWQSLSAEWITELARYGQDGQWQLRNVTDFGGQYRYEYRLVHGDYSAEFFYFYGMEDKRGIRIDDMGNRLYRYSQVMLMSELYNRVVSVQLALDSSFSQFFDYLVRFNNGTIGSEELFQGYLAGPAYVQKDRLIRELVLRALMNHNDGWMDRMPAVVRKTLIGDDYPLLSAVVCMQSDRNDCETEYQQLPPDLKGDVSLVAEMGIRLLNGNSPLAAQKYVALLASKPNDFFPAYWLQLQVGILTQDHDAVITTLNELMGQFDHIAVDKTMLTQLYPELGRQFLQSSSFRDWAKRYAKHEETTQ